MEAGGGQHWLVSFLFLQEGSTLGVESEENSDTEVTYAWRHRACTSTTERGGVLALQRWRCQQWGSKSPEEFWALAVLGPPEGLTWSFSLKVPAFRHLSTPLASSALNQRQGDRHTSLLLPVPLPCPGHFFLGDPLGHRLPKALRSALSLLPSR